MISANISRTTRKAVYRRDGYECICCGSTKYLQIHHYCPRSQGGNDTKQNLVCLCSDCHALVHGIILRNCYIDVTPQDVEQEIAEYLADLYAEDWWPYK